MESQLLESDKKSVIRRIIDFFKKKLTDAYRAVVRFISRFLRINKSPKAVESANKFKDSFKAANDEIKKITPESTEQEVQESIKKAKSNIVERHKEFRKVMSESLNRIHSDLEAPSSSPSKDVSVSPNKEVLDEMDKMLKDLLQ